MEQNGNTKKEGLYFMRKKWEIEEEYRNFCRNNKELALQTLRELTLTPTETGKEDQRIAYCMEWMKQQGMESVHTDELGNVIWEYRPEQERRFCIRRIWTLCFRWRNRWRLKKTE
mgnify:CR=1 FL=1